MVLKERKYYHYAKKWILFMITRELIVNTALQLFTRHGVKSITVDKIVKELHTSKRTLYTHFEDKNALVKACLNEYNNAASQENAEIIQSAKNVIEALGYMHQKIVSRSLQINPNFFADIANYHPGLLNVSYKEAGSFAHQQFLFIAKWGIEDGIFDEEMDVEVVGKTVGVMVKMLEDNHLFPVQKFSKERLTFGILLPYLRGQCTSKGLKLVRIQEELFRVSV